MIDRAFVRIAHGQVHYRTASPVSASGVPVYCAHAGPGSSRGLEELIATLGATRRVVAPDMMGNGDSDRPPTDAPDVAFYVDCAARTLDALGIETVDWFGTHSGAQIGLEFALAHPTRVRRLVLDAIPLFPAELREDFLVRYAPAIAADDWGGHLAWVWQYVAGLWLHFPWYRQDPAHRLVSTAVPPAAVRHALATDLLKNLSTWHLAYRAMFAQDTATLLPRVTQPTLVVAMEGDPLAVYLDAAHALVPGAEKALVARGDRSTAVAAFLAQS